MFYRIGDVHIGKRFRTGVPLNRRGDREEMLFNKFQEEIQKGIQSVKELKHHGVIQMGDLFDSFSVGYNDLFRVMNLIYAFEVNRVPAYFLAGNHDLSKEQDKISALRVLQLLTREWTYVKFIIDEPMLLQFTEGCHGLIVPYSHTKKLSEQLEPFLGYKETIHHMWGHFEEPYTEELKGWATNIYTGHVHTPRTEDNVIVQGSILPLTFGEDPNQSLMVTCNSLEELRAWTGKGHDKCFRVVLKEGESLPNDFDCLQLIEYKPNKEIEAEDLNVSFEDFNIEQLFHEALDDVDLFNEIYQRYLDHKMTELA